LQEFFAKKSMTAVERHTLIEYLENKGLSRRAACHWAGCSRAVGRYVLRRPDQEAKWLEELRKAAKANPRHGYRHVAVVSGVGFGSSGISGSSMTFKSHHNAAGNDEKRINHLVHRNKPSIRIMSRPTTFCLTVWQMGGSSKP